MQITTRWVGLTSTNDMLHWQQKTTPTMDSDAGTPQTNDIWRFISILGIQKKSQRDQSHMVVTKTRGKEPLCAPTLTKAALDRPETIGIGYISRMDDSYPLYVIFKRPKTKKIRDRCKPRHFGQASPTRMTSRIHNVKGHPVLTPRPSRSKQAMYDTLQWSKESNKNNKGDQSDLVTTKEKVQEELLTALTVTSCTLPPSNAMASR